jgi:hypothetical protein
VFGNENWKLARMVLRQNPQDNDIRLRIRDVRQLQGKFRGAIEMANDEAIGNSEPE